MNTLLETIAIIGGLTPFNVCRFDGNQVPIPAEIKTADGQGIKKAFCGVELSENGIFVDDRGRAYCCKQHYYSADED